MATTNISQRLTLLRQKMKAAGVDYYLVPSSDPHKSEYVPEHWQRRQWISGFTGSAGDVLVGLQEAYLWTDPRYFLQAEQEIDTHCYTLMKMTQVGTPLIDQWVAQQIQPFCLAVDPRVISVTQLERFTHALNSKSNLLLLKENLIDALWQDQPPLPMHPIKIHEVKYAGRSVSEKLAQVRAELKKKHCDALIINTLDSIAWLFNIRGSDIAYNPLVISNAILKTDSALLFVDEKKVTPELQTYFSKNHVTILHPDHFQETLQQLKKHVWLDANSCNAWIEQQLTHATPHRQTSPIIYFKAEKNAVEQNGMRQAHILDAIAMIKFFYWLETHWQHGVTELSAAEKLNALRREEPHCVDLSFNTISGFGPHGAIVHYSVSPQSDIPINDRSLYLVYSGGQYPMGTTDITRTIHLGEPTDLQKHHYTLVLKGHLNLRQAIFPAGTCGEHLNALAHAPLWNEALDYGHGTGHGVGCFSCVHEFPPVISARQMNEPLKPGMVVSNEPGLYLTNQYGIRIENLCVVREVYSTEKSITGHGPFYGFDDLTLVPYALNLIA